MTRLKDMLEEANQAPRMKLPKWARKIRHLANCLWRPRFPGVKHPKPFEPRIYF